MSVFCAGELYFSVRCAALLPSITRGASGVPFKCRGVPLECRGGAPVHMWGLFGAEVWGHSNRKKE